MNDASQPPPVVTTSAASSAAGGFVGALLGALAAGMLLGDNDNSGQAAVDPAQGQEQNQVQLAGRR